MKRLSYLFPVLMLTFLLSGISLAAETVWVSSTNASLKADKKASSDTIAKLAVGAELSVITMDGKWVRVKTASGKTGWIYRGKISDVQPETLSTEEKKDDGLGGLLGGLTGSDITAQSADSSRSIRGLSPEAEAYARQTGKTQVYTDALDSVLELKTDEKEIEAFLESGKIGEYAE